MGTFIGSMITIFVVSLVMKLLTNDKIMNKLDKNTSSIYKFTVHPGSGVRYLAILAITVFIGFIVLSYAVGERVFSVYVGFSIFIALGLFLLIQTLPGSEEILPFMREKKKGRIIFTSSGVWLWALVIYRLMHLRRHQCHVYSPASTI